MFKLGPVPPGLKDSYAISVRQNIWDKPLSLQARKGIWWGESIQSEHRARAERILGIITSWGNPPPPQRTAGHHHTQTWAVWSLQRDEKQRTVSSTLRSMKDGGHLGKGSGVQSPGWMCPTDRHRTHCWPSQSKGAQPEGLSAPSFCTGTALCMGQAAGTAAWVWCSHSITPHFTMTWNPGHLPNTGLGGLREPTALLHALRTASKISFWQWGSP